LCFSKVSSELVPSEDNWETVINCVLKYVQDLPYDRNDDWLCLMNDMKCEII